MKARSIKQISLRTRIVLPSILIFASALWLAYAGIAFAVIPRVIQTENFSSSDSRIANDAVCLTCHGSDKFASDESTKKLYIEKTAIRKSLHKNVLCVECHTDLADFAKMSASLGSRIKTSNSRWVRSLFIVTTDGIRHSVMGPKLYTTANMSCRNCKEHSKQSADYFASVHSLMTATGERKKVPACSTCHGSHYISRSIKNNEFRAEMHLDSKNFCGDCHKKSFDSYDDTYHGRTYKAGSPDAPACWDCHEAHLVRSNQDPKSTISKNNIVKTCGKCHVESVEAFTEYSPMIHGRQRLLDDNPVVKYKNKIALWVDKNIVSKIRDGYIDPIQTFLTTKYEEYLTERDKAVYIPTRDD